MEKGCIEVENLKILNALVNHTDGEVAYVNEEEQYYIYKNDQWLPVEAEMTENGLQLNLYDLNKQIISQLPALTKEELVDAAIVIDNWSDEDVEYYLMFGLEIGYFTLFKHDAEKSTPGGLGTQVMDCLSSLSSVIYSVQITDENVVEIWVQYMPNGEPQYPTVLYLFDYSGGVVYYE